MCMSRWANRGWLRLPRTISFHDKVEGCPCVFDGGRQRLLRLTHLARVIFYMRPAQHIDGQRSSRALDELRPYAELHHLAGRARISTPERLDAFTTSA